MFGLSRLRQLQAENDALREALAYYADVRHWQRRGTNARGEPRRWIKSRLAADRGEKARRALERMPPRAGKQSIASALRAWLQPKPKRQASPTVPMPRDTSPSAAAE